MSVNKAILVGNLGKDPEIRTMQNGKQVASFSLATSESWKDKNGERQSKTEWLNVVVFSEGLVHVVEKYLSKGSKVYVEGKIKTRKWTDQSGADKYSTEIVLEGFNASLVMLDNPKKEQEPEPYYKDGMKPAALLSDEIPFALLLPFCLSLLSVGMYVA